MFSRSIIQRCNDRFDIRHKNFQQPSMMKKAQSAIEQNVNAITRREKTEDEIV